MLRYSVVCIFLISLVACSSHVDSSLPEDVETSDMQWLAGDHHVHSEYSVKWDNSTNPPSPILGGDGRYPTSKNVQKAIDYGLSWMVTTDHGGPNHSKLNKDVAYPALLKSRQQHPDFILFYGMEFDTPAADHSSIIIPRSHHEEDQLFDLESQFSRLEIYNGEEERDTEDKMLSALEAMKQQSPSPLVIAHHPARSAKALGDYGKTGPHELRQWNNTAPDIAVGMEAAPGHQAATIKPFGLSPTSARGSYSNFPTMGGFDQMTAIVGGFWDSMLGEGRHWWITSNSDSHVNWRDGGNDFWPGEYSKTYVLAHKNHASILDGIRSGRMFVSQGDLIQSLDFSATAPNGHHAGMGDTLLKEEHNKATIFVKIVQPDTPNNNGDTPTLERIDLIVGRVSDYHDDLTTDENTSTKVLKRLYPADWDVKNGHIEFSYTLPNEYSAMYVRLRGTNTQELEPEIDPRGEDPWTDLWFYSNPIFINEKHDDHTQH